MHPKVSSPLRGDWAEAPPWFREYNITVTERRVRNTSKIPPVTKRSQEARLPEKGRPHRGLRDVRRGQTGNGYDDGENIRWPPTAGALCSFPE